MRVIIITPSPILYDCTNDPDRIVIVYLSNTCATCHRAVLTRRRSLKTNCGIFIVFPPFARLLLRVSKLQRVRIAVVNLFGS